MSEKNEPAMFIDPRAFLLAGHDGRMEMLRNAAASIRAAKSPPWEGGKISAFSPIKSSAERIVGPVEIFEDDESDDR